MAVTNSPAGTLAARALSAAMVSAMGATAHRVHTLDELSTVLRNTKGKPGVHVVVIDVALHHWSEGGSFWEVGVPEVSDRPAVDAARAELDAGKANQRMIWH